MRTQVPEDDQQGVGEGEDHQHEQGHGHSRPQQFGQHQVDGQNSEQEEKNPQTWMEENSHQD